MNRRQAFLCVLGALASALPITLLASKPARKKVYLLHDGNDEYEIVITASENPKALFLKHVDSIEDKGYYDQYSHGSVPSLIEYEDMAGACEVHEYPDPDKSGTRITTLLECPGD